MTVTPWHYTPQPQPSIVSHPHHRQHHLLCRYCLSHRHIIKTGHKSEPPCPLHPPLSSSYYSFYKPACACRTFTRDCRWCSPYKLKKYEFQSIQAYNMLTLIAGPHGCSGTTPTFVGITTEAVALCGPPTMPCHPHCWGANTSTVRP